MAAVKLLLVERDNPVTRKLAEELRKSGFECQMSDTVAGAKEAFVKMNPDMVLTELTLSDGTAVEFIRFCRSRPVVDEPVRIAVASAHSQRQNIKSVIEAGADDYIVKPLELEALVQRFAFLMQKKREFHRMAEKDKDAVEQERSRYLNIMELLMRQASSHRPEPEVLFNVAKMKAMMTKSLRTSIIEIDRVMQEGWVRASSDDVGVKDLKLDLKKYPEIQFAMNNEKLVAVENLESNPVLSEIKKNFQKIHFNALIVVPIYQNGHFWGVVSSRVGELKRPFLESELMFSQIVGHTLTLLLSQPNRHQKAA